MKLIQPTRQFLPIGHKPDNTGPDRDEPCVAGLARRAASPGNKTCPRWRWLRLAAPDRLVREGRLALNTLQIRLFSCYNYL